MNTDTMMAHDVIGLMKELDKLRAIVQNAQAQLTISDAYAAEDNRSQVPSTWQIQNALILDALAGGDNMNKYGNSN